jgi:hypothetical protein
VLHRSPCSDAEISSMASMPTLRTAYWKSCSCRGRWLRRCQASNSCEYTSGLDVSRNAQARRSASPANLCLYCRHIATLGGCWKNSKRIRTGAAGLRRVSRYGRSMSKDSCQRMSPLKWGRLDKAASCSAVLLTRCHYQAKMQWGCGDRFWTF